MEEETKVVGLGDVGTKVQVHRPPSCLVFNDGMPSFSLGYRPQICMNGQ